MPLKIPSSEKTVVYQPHKKARGSTSGSLTWLVSLAGLGVITVALLLPESPYFLSLSLWYADFRFWPSWVSGSCWLVVLWAGVSMVVSLLVPRNEERFFLLRRKFFQRFLAIVFAFFIGSVWYNHATLPLTTVFAPILSPVSDYVAAHYTHPLADYYTTGERQSPTFWPTTLVVLVAAAFIIWRFWYHFKRWRKPKVAAVAVLPACLLATLLGADAPAPPPKVKTSVGIYDVQSKDDLINFSAEDIRDLVKMDDERIRGAGTTPHPILVYCFEERSFQYTGGKYDNAEIKYRLRVPKKIIPGKKYPLVVHLHGIGEAGKDNMLSLAHLHSILPLMVGPEQLDFYLLVLQCPRDNRIWTFKPEKDGNLDVVIAATDHVIKNNPIDVTRLSAFGLSSGGYGVWQWIMREPDKFAAVVPTSCGSPKDFQKLLSLTDTSIWTFCNKNDKNAPIETIHEAMQIIGDSGGYMKLTQFDQGGHAAWRPAMDEYNCFAWMIAQKRGGWFNPPPEQKVYQGRSLKDSFFAFFLPLGLAAVLFIFQRSRYCERLHERIVEEFAQYNSRAVDDEDEDGEDDDEGEETESDDSEEETASTDGFRIWSDITGTKRLKGKMVGFQGDNQVRLQSPEGKITPFPIKQFCTVDQALIREIQAKQPLPEGFQRWANFDGSQFVVAKFVGFQPGDKVMLQSPTGQTLAVPIDQLGQAEREFLASEREQVVVESRSDGFREWADLSGTQKFTAKLLGFQDDQAQFELEDGQKTTVPIDQLAVGDQVLLTRLMDEEPPT